MLKDKMWFQDYPMVTIMCIQFFSTFGSGNQLEMIISLVQIATTGMSIISGMISLKFASDEKGVDMRLVSKKIFDRQAEIKAREIELLEEKANGVASPHASE